VTAAEASRKEVRLDLEGMTCASCVARIERKLNKLDGVDASVNFATEQATVRCDPSVTADELVSAVEAAGYHAHPVEEGRHHHHDEPVAVLRRRLAVERGLLVEEARRVALRAGEPARGILEPELHGLRARLDTLGTLADVDAPRAVDVGAGRADRELDAVQQDRRHRLLAALRVRPHQDALLGPLLRDHRHRSVMRGIRRWAAQPVVDQTDLRHAGK